MFHNDRCASMCQSAQVHQGLEEWILQAFPLAELFCIAYIKDYCCFLTIFSKSCNTCGTTGSHNIHRLLVQNNQPCISIEPKPTEVKMPAGLGSSWVWVLGIIILDFSPLNWDTGRSYALKLFCGSSPLCLKWHTLNMHHWGRMIWKDNKISSPGMVGTGRRK